MITEKELNISNKSYVNKDFATIYSEILSLCEEITSRWTPDTSNESDPGIVLLKILAAVGDKLNYNIDKNTLECFMPSATQETSMRNLCEANGYNMGYYKSATTDVSFMYTNDLDSSFTLPKYDTVVSSSDDTITYTLIKDCQIASKNVTYTAEAIQGTIETLSVGDTNLIQLSNLDDNNRIYFPESMIAENGIFVTDQASSNAWTKVDNLYVEELNNKIYKFGFDSAKNSPYIEFPSDIANLIGTGLIIKYIVTSGAEGNISANTLTKLVSPSSADDVSDLADYLTINNLSSTSSGSNPETIDEAYNNFKKTVGTFNTLVTARDYANWIYNAYISDMSRPAVSNVQVADRRTDFNYSNNVTTYTASNEDYVICNTDDENITPFELCLYPLASMGEDYTLANYNKSFKPVDSTEIDSAVDIKYQTLNEVKTLSHDYKDLDSQNDVYCFKNYYTLNVKIATYDKVDSTQQADIIANVKYALYKAFNARNVEFGEEIPYDSILKIIQSADSRIYNVRLDDPVLSTYVMNPLGTEFDLSDATSTVSYNSRLNLIVKNVLNGRISLFDYDDSFNIKYGQLTTSNDSWFVPQYTYSAEVTSDVGASITDESLFYSAINKQIGTYTLSYNNDTEGTWNFKRGSTVLEEAIALSSIGISISSSPTATSQIIIVVTRSVEYAPSAYDRISQAATNVNISSTSLSSGYTLRDNEVIQFISPNLETSVEYSTYVNYRFTSSNVSNYIPANTLYKLVDGDELKVVYTDSESDVEYHITYTYNSITTNGTVKEVSENIFCPTFDLYVMDESVTSRTIRTITYGGLSQVYWVLGSNETICKKEYVATTLDSSYLSCYWQRNTTNNVLFSKDDIKIIGYDSASQPIYDTKIEILLDNNEYFMYSNKEMTELMILGSGTKLTLTNINRDTFVSWSIDSENMIDIDTINSKGLAAFSSFNWQTRLLSNTPILVNEMNIVSCTSGDTVTITPPANNDTYTLNNDWKDFSNYTISIIRADGTTTTLDTISIPEVGWEGRSRYDLNCSAGDEQQILSNQSITLYDQDGDAFPIQGTDSNPTYISFNYTTQYTGSSKKFNVDTKTVNGLTVTLTDGIKALTYHYYVRYTSNNPITEVVYPQSGNTSYSGLPVYLDSSNRLPLSLEGFGASVADSQHAQANLYVELPILTMNKDVLLMMYYDAAAVGSSGVTVTSIGGNICFFNSSTLTTSLNLHSGLNIIQIPKDSQVTMLRVNHGLASTDKLFVGKQQIIDGLNPAISVLDESIIFNKIKALSTVDNVDIFNYLHRVANDYAIDISSTETIISPRVFWDENNIANKFTIGELDFEDSVIEIMPSSQK